MYSQQLAFLHDVLNLIVISSSTNWPFTHLINLFSATVFFCFVLQDVRLITLKTNNSTLDYKPGDVYNIRPRNSQEDIDDLFNIFKEHNIDIKPYHRLLVKQCYEGKFYSSSKL